MNIKGFYFKVQTSFAWFICYGRAKTNLAILTFLYCRRVENSSVILISAFCQIFFVQFIWLDEEFWTSMINKISNSRPDNLLAASGGLIEQHHPGCHLSEDFCICQLQTSLHLSNPIRNMNSFIKLACCAC